jgi:hypothetical protein
MMQPSTYSMVLASAEAIDIVKGNPTQIPTLHSKRRQRPPSIYVDEGGAVHFSWSDLS